MLIALLIGGTIGFILAIPPGPVAVASMRLSMDKGLKQGILLALGNGLIDFIYCSAAIFATSAAITAFDTFSKEYPLTTLIFQLIVVALILVYGIINIRTQDKNSLDGEIQSKNKSGKIYEYLSHKGPFLLGIAVALTNIANPTFLPVLAGVTAKVQTMGWIESSVPNLFMFAIGFGMGNVAWLYSLMKMLTHYQSKMSDRTIGRIRRFSGLTLIGVGTYLGYHVLIFTKWSEILLNSKIYEAIRFVFTF